jgi:thioredoxin reductase (NADPH)
MEREDDCYLKIICNKADNNRVIGFHILSPHAGEITQGIGVAIKCGLTKDQLDNTVGIHPTIAEEFTTLTAVKGVDDAKKEGC